MSLLSEDEQADVLSKFVAAGYVGAKQKMVPRLSNQELECIGIQPQLVRSALLQGFADGGPSKTILLVDSEGTERQIEFSDKQDFNKWIQSNTLMLVLPSGTKRVVAAWERLEDGGMYFTNKTFEKREPWPRLYNFDHDAMIAAASALHSEEEEEDYPGGAGVH
ncbi:hypothetical protein QJQ45_004313 [Haematococcus lacustris]|nr:hypothetical protein QJQ45_004313 [Haematococcus lacustris]